MEVAARLKHNITVPIVSMMSTPGFHQNLPKSSPKKILYIKLSDHELCTLTCPF